MYHGGLAPAQACDTRSSEVALVCRMSLLKRYARIVVIRIIGGVAVRVERH